MDPDVVLLRLLDGVTAMAEGESTHNEACEFAIAFENLHEWLEKDGFAPAAWGDPEAKLLQFLLQALNAQIGTLHDRRIQEEADGNDGEALILQGYEERTGALAAMVVDWLDLPVAERPWRKQK
jgi:hypothetical protein